ncbi:MAG: hypothetical protein ACI9JN_002768 [Bacteroidia bacterium]
MKTKGILFFKFFLVSFFFQKKNENRVKGACPSADGVITP